MGLDQVTPEELVNLLAQYTRGQVAQMLGVSTRRIGIAVMKDPDTKKLHEAQPSVDEMNKKRLAAHREMLRIAKKTNQLIYGNNAVIRRLGIPMHIPLTELPGLE